MVQRTVQLPHRHLLVSVLFVAPLALGSFHPWIIALLCAVAGAAVVLLALEGPEGRVRPGLLGLGLTVMLLYTCLQLIPLPPSVTRSLWHSGHEI